MDIILIINTIIVVLLFILVVALVASHLVEVKGYKSEIKMLKKDKEDLHELNGYYVKTFKEKTQDKEENGFSLGEKRSKT